MQTRSISGLMASLLALGMGLSLSSQASAQGAVPGVVVHPDPVVVPTPPAPVVQPVIVAQPIPVAQPAPPVLISPVPIVVVPTFVQSVYYAPVPLVAPVVAPVPVGGVYQTRVNPGLFGQMNYRAKGIDPCFGPYKQHTRVGWAGASYRVRAW